MTVLGTIEPIRLRITSCSECPYHSEKIRMRSRKKVKLNFCSEEGVYFEDAVYWYKNRCIMKKRMGLI
jgi:hypothetical protein